METSNGENCRRGTSSCMEWIQMRRKREQEAIGGAEWIQLLKIARTCSIFSSISTQLFVNTCLGFTNINFRLCLPFPSQSAFSFLAFPFRCFRVRRAFSCISWVEQQTLLEFHCQVDNDFPFDLKSLRNLQRWRMLTCDPEYLHNQQAGP